MKIIAACLLAVLGGKTSPTAEDIKEILASVGANADDEKIDLLISQVKGKDITELVAAGREMLASVGAGAAISGAAQISYAPEPAVDDKEEAEVEEKEESDDDFMVSLFD